jgi:hypothetical protein
VILKSHEVYVIVNLKTKEIADVTDDDDVMEIYYNVLDEDGGSAYEIQSWFI